MRSLGKRRVCALILVWSMIIGSMSVMAGCGKSSSKTDGKSKYITQAEWLGLINEQFGMTSYQNTEPYFSEISNTSEYYDTYQIAGEWKVIDDSVQAAPTAEVTQEEAAITLVNAAGLSSGEKVEIANADKLKSPEKVEIAVQNHIFELKGKKFDYSAKIERDEAEEIIQLAKDKWANPEYEMVEEYEVKEDVVNLMSSDSQTIDYAISDDGKVYLPTEEPELVKAGETYVLPANEENRFAQVFKAESVEVVDGGIIISNSDEELKFEDVVEEINVQNSFTPDFTNCEITDGLGNILIWNNNNVTAETDVVNPNDYSVSNLGKMNNSVALEETGISDSSASFEFQVDDIISVSGTVASDSVSFELSVAKDLPKGGEVSATKSYELSDFNVDGKVDYKFLGGLQEARASYTYTAKESTSISYSHGLDKISGLNPDRDITDDADAEALLRSCLEGLLDATDGGYTANSILIVSIPTPLTIGGVAGVTIEIRVGFSIEGKVELIVTTKTTQGVEYKKGQGLRVINEKHVDKDISAQAQVEVYLYVGAVVEAFTFNIVDVGAEVGIGGTYQSTWHVLDYSEDDELAYQMAVVETGLPMMDIEISLFESYSATGKIQIQRCADVKVYFIFRITAGKNSLVGELVSGSWDICGEDNGPFLYEQHFENGEAVDECTLEFRTERKEQATETESAQNHENESIGNTDENNETLVGEVVDIDKYLLTVSVGEKGTIEVTHLPEGYKMSDVKWSTKDENIAVVNNSGEVTGKNPGSTIIKVSTSDNKYSVECTVTVYEDNTIVFEPLE